MEKKRDGLSQGVFLEEKSPDYIKRLEYNNLILKAQLEVSLDGILVVDEDWNMVVFNERFCEMWSIPDHIREERNDRESLQTVLSKLKYPDLFLKRVEELMESPDEYSRDELELLDGRYFDRYSAPVYDESGKCRGRVWFFRDVTELTNARRKLRDQNTDLEKRVADRTREMEKLNRELLERESECLLHQHELEAKNIGLRTLLSSVEEEKRRLEERTVSNIREALVPVLDMLVTTSLTPRQEHIVETLEDILANIVSPMNLKLQRLRHPLTPTEVKVANSIRAGHSSKEIALLMNCSERTVEGHRQSIRRKIGIKKGDNLMRSLRALS